MKMLSILCLGLLIGISSAYPSKNAVGEAKVGTVPCTTPAPESILPCTCSVDVETNERFMSCDFEFAADEDVTDMVENIFSQFDDSNNKFSSLSLHMGGVEGNVANLALNEKTSGKLKFNSFQIISFCNDQSDPKSGQKLFTNTAFQNSKETLTGINMLPFCPGAVFAVEHNFFAGLENLSYLSLDSYDYDTQPFPEHTSTWDSVQTLLLVEMKMSDLTASTLPPMSNLKVLEVDTQGIRRLSTGIIENFPMLEEFWSSRGDIEVVEAGFFSAMTNSKTIHMSINRISSIDLTGLSPNTELLLSNNQLKKLTEANFRPFVESVINTKNATGKIILKGNRLDCSCDLKWLVSELMAAHVFEGGVCADGTALADVDPAALNEQCPDVQI